MSMCNNMPLSVNEKRKIFDLIINLQNQLQQKENIIKEAKEYLDIDESIRKNCKRYDVNGIAILEILDKEDK